MNRPAIVIHGGSGTIPKSRENPEIKQQYLTTLQAVLDVGFSELVGDTTAIDAVTNAVATLEDCELFNAGKGSVFTASGDHKMDAAIMDGRTLRAGAVADIHSVKNPILFAKLILKESSFVFLSGDKATEYARGEGLIFEDDSYFFNQYRYDQWQAIKGTGDVRLDHSEDSEQLLGTVGAVAVDMRGNVAAATSTGGMTNKSRGRIGDSPLIGAGTYANNNTCAVSCTGHGEYFIRVVAAYDVSSRIEYGGQSLEQAARATVEKVHQIGGTGGLIAVDSQGNITMPFNSEGMYRGLKTIEQNFTSIH